MFIVSYVESWGLNGYLKSIISKKSLLELLDFLTFIKFSTYRDSSGYIIPNYIVLHNKSLLSDKPGVKLFSVYIYETSKLESQFKIPVQM